MRSILITIGILSWIAIPVFAQEVLELKPVLIGDDSRTFLEQNGTQIEKTMVVEGKGSKLFISFSSDSALDITVGFPLESRFSENIQINPLHMLQVSHVQPSNGVSISIDLTQSPAWSPARNQYILGFKGPPGAIVSIQDIHIEPATLLQSLRGYVHQFFIQEPVLLSSINFLWGFYVWGVSFSVVWGFGFVAVIMAIWLYGLKVGKRDQSVKNVFLCLIFFLLLYDARLSLDLFRVSAQDISGWYTEDDRQYRQLGPIFGIANFLKTEQLQFGKGMKVAICFDGSDFLFKQLRYHLYPIPVYKANTDWSDATHLVMIDTGYQVADDGAVSCGTDILRKVEFLQEFPQHSGVFRFTNSL